MNPARCAFDFRHRRRKVSRRFSNAQRAGFMQLAAAGDALDLMHVERHGALGAVGRENRRSSTGGISPHPPQTFPKRARDRRRSRYTLQDHDPIRPNRIMISSFCLSMIFSENRFPPIGSWPEGMLFRIML